MKSSSLQSKTVRPGLMAYSFYRSDRHPPNRRPAAKARPKHSHGHALKWLIGVSIVAAVAFAGVRAYQSHVPAPVDPQAAAIAEGPKECADNTEDRLIIVSIERQHLWACQNHAVRYNSPVVTGREKLVENQTPRGTYHIYAKQTDTTLTGSDSNGQWSDSVRYWMPFLDNQYGTYGFHDATWRPSSDFGNINPDSDKASHGCINLPLATAQWLYDWAPVGTTVTVKD